MKCALKSEGMHYHGSEDFNLNSVVLSKASDCLQIPVCLFFGKFFKCRFQKHVLYNSPATIFELVESHLFF